MSSINDNKLDKFWQERLRPVARTLKASGAELLDTKTSGSSWNKIHADVPELSDLSPGVFEEKFRARLESEGFKELADIIPDMMELATELRPSGDTDEEVDEFVYVMH